MRYRWFFGIFLACMTSILLWGTMRLSAQVAWSVWVYDASTGQLLRVDTGGNTIDAQQLPVMFSNTYPEKIIPSHDGTLFAYINPTHDAIRVYSTANNSVISTIQRSDIGIAHNRDDWLALSDVAFDLTDEHIVYTEYLGGMGWQIHVYNLAQQAIISTLHYRDAVSNPHRALHGAVVPQIRAIQGEQITFVVETGFPVDTRSYHWFYLADTLRETVAVPDTISQNFIPTGEVITAVHDYRYPADTELFPMSTMQLNALHAYTIAQGRRPIATVADASYEQLWFVQGGERLLAQAQVSDSVRVRVLYGRDGAEIRRYPLVGDSLAGTPDGFVYTTEVREQTAIVDVRTRTDSAGNTLWIQAGDWQIAWAGENTPFEQLTAFTALAQAEQDPPNALSNDAPQPTVTALPSYPAFRTIGQAIQIYVPEDGYLNMRAEPSLTAGVVTLLQSGTRGTIIAGPESRDGYIWWQISVGSQTGWMVESLEDSLALIPPQLIPSITPTPTQTTMP